MGHLSNDLPSASRTWANSDELDRPVPQKQTVLRGWKRVKICITSAMRIYGHLNLEKPPFDSSDSESITINEEKPKQKRDRDRSPFSGLNPKQIAYLAIKEITKIVWTNGYASTDKYYVIKDYLRSLRKHFHCCKPRHRDAFADVFMANVTQYLFTFKERTRRTSRGLFEDRLTQMMEVSIERLSRP